MIHYSVPAHSRDSVMNDGRRIHGPFHIETKSKRNPHRARVDLLDRKLKPFSVQVRGSATFDGKHLRFEYETVK